MRIYSINIGGGGASTLSGRAQTAAITNGSSSVAVTFSSALSDANYALLCTITNVTDADPIKLEITNTVKTLSGFTATFNTAADSGNYLLEYTAIPYV